MRARSARAKIFFAVIDVIYRCAKKTVTPFKHACTLKMPGVTLLPLRTIGTNYIHHDYLVYCSKLESLLVRATRRVMSWSNCSICVF